LVLNGSSAFAGWVEQPASIPSQLWVAYAVNSQIVWAAGQTGQVARTSNGGMTWLSRPVSGASGLPALYAFDDQVCLVGDQLGHIYRTSNGGDTWGLVYTGAVSSFNGIHFFDGLHGWAIGDPVGGFHILIETTDGGLSWHSSPGTAPPAHAFNEQGIRRSFDWVGSELGMFGTNKWKIWRTTNSGAQWDSVTTEMQWTPGLVVNADGRGLLGGRTEGIDDPKVGRSTDFGQTWTWVPNPPQTSTFNTFDWIEGTDEVWASTLQTGLFQSTNGGLDWTRYDLGPFGSYVTEDIDFVDTGTGWAVGWSSGVGGRIWRWSATTDVTPSAANSLSIDVHPNPFTSEVSFQSHAGGGPVRIVVYDMLGRCLWQKVVAEAGAQPSTIQWNGRDDAGRMVPNGVYAYRLQSKSEETTGRLIKVR
jgi:photosystem II stability/assembly factor-like uncharacterized protein